MEIETGPTDFCTNFIEPPDVSGHKRTYFDLLSLAQAGEIIPRDPEFKLPVSTPADREATDDPHRLAKLFIDQFASHQEIDLFGQPTGETTIAIRFWRQQYWRWKGRCYRLIEKDELKAELTKSIKLEFDRVARFSATTSTDPDDVIVAKKVTRNLVNNVLGAIEGLAVVPAEVEQMTWLEPDEKRGVLATHKNYVAMANGIIDLDALMAEKPGSETPIPLTPKWFSPVCMSYPFDLEAECPKWMAFLDKNLKGDNSGRDILQEWAGYCIFPGLLETKFLILEGEGSNGKSVYMAAIEAMLGFNNCSHVQLEMFGVRFMLTPTLGKLVNICGDAGEIDKIAEGCIKGFTDGNPMQFDRKGIQPLDAVPTAKLMIACNTKPKFGDRTDGIWRRVLLVEFAVKIAETEKIKGMKTNQWWFATGELPGIFNWAIAGQARLMKQGQFTESETQKKKIADYRAENNPARKHLAETYEEGTEFDEFPAAEVYDRYKYWCEENNYRPLASGTFGTELHRIFRNVQKMRGGTKSNRYCKYVGLAFKIIPDDEDDETENTASNGHAEKASMF